MTIASPSPRRRYLGKSLGGATSRVLTIHAAENALTVKNARFDTHGLRWTRLRHVPEQPRITTPLDLEEYLKALFGPVHCVGRGRSGSAFTLRVTRDVLKRLEVVFGEFLSHVIVQKMPKVGSTVLIKIVDLRKGSSMKEAIAHYKRETEAHLHICRHPSISVGRRTSCSVVLNPCEYVPYLFAFGADLEHGVALSCMQYIKGVPIYKVPITAEIFLETQKAMCALWASCVDHNDSHFENVIVTPAGKVYIIDFEFSARIPKSKQRQFLQFLDMPGGVTSLDSAAQVFFARHSNAIQFQRSGGRMQFYNPGYKAIRVLWNRMSRREQRRLLEKYEGETFACVLAKQ